VNAPSLPSLLVSHWQVTWSLDLPAFACAAVYTVTARHVSSGWPRRRTGSFLAGIACVLVALQSGIDSYDDRMLSVHMVQHMLLLMLAPLLLLGGRPLILALRTLPRRRRPVLARTLTRIRPFTSPPICIAVFSAVLVLSHLPSFYDATLRHTAMHDAEHAAYLLAGLLLWWPILDGDPVSAHRLGGLGRLIYILAAMPAMGLVGAYLNRHPTLVYPAYGPPARMLGISAVVDQQQAGAIMWVAGSVIVTAVGLWAVVSALLAEERRQQAREAVLS
jgi:putative membrane protein